MRAHERVPQVAFLARIVMSRANWFQAFDYHLVALVNDAYVPPSASLRGERGAEWLVPGPPSAPLRENQALETDSPSGAALYKYINENNN